MSKTLAVVLSIIGGLFLLGIIVVGSVAYLFYQAKENLNRTAEKERRRNEEVMKKLEEARSQNEERLRKLKEELARLPTDSENIGKDSKEFGVKTNNEGCLKEALARHKRDKSFTGQISTQGFLTVCLQASEPSPGFCDGVPQLNEKVASANWTLKKCSDAGLQNDQSCQRLFGVVQSFCHRSEYSPEK